MNDHFCGWYYKCQSEKETLAVIPAVHRANGKTTCSIQLITEAASWSVPFPGSAFHGDGMQVSIGENRFGPPGTSPASSRALPPRIGHAPVRPFHAPSLRYHGPPPLCALSGVPPQRIQYAPHGDRHAAGQRCSLRVSKRNRIRGGRPGPLLSEGIRLDPMRPSGGGADAGRGGYSLGRLPCYMGHRRRPLAGQAVPPCHLFGGVSHGYPGRCGYHPARPCPSDSQAAGAGGPASPGPFRRRHGADHP